MGNIISRWITTLRGWVSHPFRMIFGETRRIQSVPQKWPWLDRVRSEGTCYGDVQTKGVSPPPHKTRKTYKLPGGQPKTDKNDKEGNGNQIVLNPGNPPPAVLNPGNPPPVPPAPEPKKAQT